MDQTALYDDDIYAWSQHQARIIRGLGRSGLRLPNDLDLEHVAEEIEDVGNEQRFATESNLLLTLVHLIKAVVLPDDPAVRHWLKEIATFLHNAARRYRPSMRRVINVEKLWIDARRLATQELEIDGHAVPPLPAAPPFSLEQLLGDGVDPRDLAARLLEAIDDAPRNGRRP